ALLGSGAGQLGNVMAIQQRLTRQFFDAQRSILTRRAEVDTEVAAIEAAAGAGGAAARHLHPAGSARSGVRCADTAARQEIAALGVSVVRTVDDVEAFAEVINDALAPEEADGVVAQRQLAAVLDEWWRMENQEGRALVDDAHARAAVMQHVAAIEAREACGPIDASDRAGAAEEAPSPAVSHLSNAQLPVDVEAALDGAGSIELHALLATLAESLEPVAQTGAPREPDPQPSASIITFDPAPATGHGSATAFQHFWASEPAVPVEQRRFREWLPTHVIVPITAATSVIALVMAWLR
ncbi:MAG: hypothetical protein WCC60_07590, partial [Ilumatobacteraceae bacterium]